MLQFPGEQKDLRTGFFRGTHWLLLQLCISSSSNHKDYSYKNTKMTSEHSQTSTTNVFAKIVNVYYFRK